MIPKMSVNPTPRKNSSAACDRALTLWFSRNASVVTWAAGKRGAVFGLQRVARAADTPEWLAV
jgi:hypothetical protein